MFHSTNAPQGKGKCHVKKHRAIAVALVLFGASAVRADSNWMPQPISAKLIELAKADKRAEFETEVKANVEFGDFGIMDLSTRSMVNTAEGPMQKFSIERAAVDIVVQNIGNSAQLDLLYQLEREADKIRVAAKQGEKPKGSRRAKLERVLIYIGEHRDTTTSWKEPQMEIVIPPNTKTDAAKKMVYDALKRLQ